DGGSVVIAAGGGIDESGNQPGGGGLPLVDAHGNGMRSGGRGSAAAAEVDESDGDGGIRRIGVGGGSEEGKAAAGGDGVAGYHGGTIAPVDMRNVIEAVGLRGGIGKPGDRSSVVCITGGCQVEGHERQTGIVYVYGAADGDAGAIRVVDADIDGVDAFLG